MKHDTHKTLTFLSFLLPLALLIGCCTHEFARQENPEAFPSFSVPEKIRVALVLGSGGVRGMAHVGVLEELEAAEIPIDLIVGCSVGSIVGALYADNPNAQSIKHAVWGIRTHSLLDFDFWNCRYGLFQGRSLQRTIDEYLSSQIFSDLKIPLVIVASDLHTGELVPMASGDLVKAVHSSCSIPFLFVPCEHNGRVLVDGGVINPVPVKVAADLGAEIVIAVDLCELLDNTFPTTLFGVATRSAEIAFMWQNEVCTRNADIIIRPKTCGVGAFNDNMKKQIYLAGRNAAKEQIPRIKELLASLPKDPCTTKRIINLNCYTPQIYLDQ